MEKLLGKKRQLNLIELVIQIISLFSFFAIKSVEMTYTRYSGVQTTYGTARTSLFGLAHESSFGLLYLFAGLMFVNTILCLVSILGNNADKDGKMHIAIPIINLVFLVLVSGAGTPYGYDELVINIVYLVFMFICLIGIIVLAILKRSALVIPKETNTATIIMQQESNADELKKFKELLDNGIITQEEFDAKKKELLGL